MIEAHSLHAVHRSEIGFIGQILLSAISTCTYSQSLMLLDRGSHCTLQRLKGSLHLGILSTHCKSCACMVDHHYIDERIGANSVALLVAEAINGFIPWLGSLMKAV